MLEVTNVACVRGSRTLFSDLNLSIPSATLLQVRGANGSGKTSLLRIVCGLMSPDTGEVLWNGAKIRALGEEFHSELIYLGHRNGVKEELSALENLQISNGVSGNDLQREAAFAALKKVGLEGRERLPARLLSEGQRRRSALARLLTRVAKLWVLDEVLASLDAAAVNLFSSLLEEHLTAGGIAVVATHQELVISAGSFQRLELSS